MNIIKFLRSLAPTLSGSTIENDVANQIKTLNKSLLPKYKMAATLCSSEFKASQNLEFEKAARARLRYNQPNFLQYVINWCANYERVLKHLQTLVPETFERDVARESMSAQGAQILQLLEYSGALQSYLLRVLDQIVIQETDATSGRVREDSMTPADRDWLEKNRGGFFEILLLLSTPATQIAAMLKSIPEVTLGPANADTVVKAMGANKLDPMRLGLMSGFFDIGQIVNPLYHIAVMRAEYEVTKYRELEETIRLLELRLLEMKQANQGKQDPRLQKTIEYHEGRVQRLRAELDELTEKYGFDK